MNILLLPQDILIEIFQDILAIDSYSDCRQSLITLKLVCSRWREICLTQCFQRIIGIRLGFDRPIKFIYKREQEFKIAGWTVKVVNAQTILSHGSRTIILQNCVVKTIDDLRIFEDTCCAMNIQRNLLICDMKTCTVKEYSLQHLPLSMGCKISFFLGNHKNAFIWITNVENYMYLFSEKEGVATYPQKSVTSAAFISGGLVQSFTTNDIYYASKDGISQLFCIRDLGTLDITGLQSTLINNIVVETDKRTLLLLSTKDRVIATIDGSLAPMKTIEKFFITASGEMYDAKTGSLIYWPSKGMCVHEAYRDMDDKDYYIIIE